MLVVLLFLFKLVSWATAAADIKQEYYVITSRCDVKEDDIIMTSRGTTYCGFLCLSHEDCSGFYYTQVSGTCRLFGENSITNSSVCSENDVGVLEVYVEDRFATNTSTNGSHVTCENGGHYDAAKGKCVCQDGWIGISCDQLAGDCSALHQSGQYSIDGVYYIHPSAAPNPFQVNCFMNPNAGLTKIQVHRSAEYNFNKSWDDYKHGFKGSLADEWLGNDRIHYLTQSHAQTLLLDAKNGSTYFQYYHHNFIMGSEADNYSMSFGSVGSTFGDEFPPCWNPPYTDIPFSTYDRDNDGDPEVNCAALHGGGWWFQYPNCTLCNFNGGVNKDGHIRQGLPNETFILPLDPDFSPEYVLMALFWMP